MLARGILAAIGLAYVALAVWCAVRPQATANAVGFDLRRGGGESEYFTVYGGLQLGLGLVFLLPLLKPEAVGVCALACIAIHASLVVFRTLSFIKYSQIPTTTYTLAGVEWAILIAAVAAFALRAKPAAV